MPVDQPLCHREQLLLEELLVSFVRDTWPEGIEKAFALTIYPCILTFSLVSFCFDTRCICLGKQFPGQGGLLIDNIVFQSST